MSLSADLVGRKELSSDAESLAAYTLAKVGKNLGTDMVLLGSYVLLPGDKVRLDLRLQGLAADPSAWAGRVGGPRVNHPNIVTMPLVPRQALHRGVGAEDQIEARASPRCSLRVLRLDRPASCLLSLRPVLTPRASGGMTATECSRATIAIPRSPGTLWFSFVKMTSGPFQQGAG